MATGPTCTERKREITHKWRNETVTANERALAAGGLATRQTQELLSAVLQHGASVNQEAGGARDDVD
jgi:hypothetical protein